MKKEDTGQVSVLLFDVALEGNYSWIHEEN